MGIVLAIRLLWRQVLESVESAQATSAPLAGLVLDLTKAFNLLPRLPCLGLALRFGLNYGTACAWAGALAQMTRRFWIDGSVSQGVPSNRGFPEGCGLSCLAMLVLNQAWHSWIHEAHRLFRPLSYVDNWEIMCSDPTLIRSAFDSTVAFTAALDLKIDRQKTFCWAVAASDRKLLRQEGFVVLNSCRDLGAQMVFSRQIRNATLQDRFDNMPELWVKLRRAKGSYVEKLRIIRTVGWPRALHGVASAYIGRKHFHKLRTGLMHGLALNKPGANAYLQCCLEENLDPQCWAILQSIREWRTTGDRSHQAFIVQCAVDSNFAITDSSLTGILCQRLQVLGWQLHETGHVTDSLGTFDLVQVNWPELISRFNHAWQSVVASQVRHRLDFEHFALVDVSATRDSLCHLDSYDCGVIQHQLIGITVTNAHACHWSVSGSQECQACGQPDSLFHRFWVCAASADLRAKIPWEVLQLVPKLPKVLVCQGWTLSSPYEFAWKQYLLGLPTMVPHCHCPTDASWVDLFTDGSCLFPTMADYRLSAWSVCFAPPATTEFAASDVLVLGASPLGGLIQTAFRSELFALVVSLTWAAAWQKNVRVWTDCQGVIDKFCMLIDGGVRLHQCCANSDLWAEIQRLVADVGRSHIRLIKVSAHESWSSETCEAQRWVQIGNQCADRSAKIANQSRSLADWQLWSCHAAAIRTHRSVADDIRLHQLAVCKRWTEEYGPSQTSTTVTPVMPRRARQLVFRCEGLVLPEVAPEVIVQSWGAVFAEQFRGWWTSILEPTEGLSGWVSFSQLYIDFQTTVRHPGLLKQARIWIDPTLVPGCMPERFPFRRRSKWFRLLVQQWTKALGIDASTATTRPRSTFLVCHVGCIALPAKQSRLDGVEHWLRNHLKQPVSGLGVGLDTLPPGW